MGVTIPICKNIKHKNIQTTKYMQHKQVCFHLYCNF